MSPGLHFLVLRLGGLIGVSPSALLGVTFIPRVYDFRIVVETLITYTLNGFSWLIREKVFFLFFGKK